MSEASFLERARLREPHQLPALLGRPFDELVLEKEELVSLNPKAKQSLKKYFPQSSDQPLLKATKGRGTPNLPLKVGVVLSGGQAAGGHNAIAGLFDALKKMHPESSLFGFLDGPLGLIENRNIEITLELVDRYRNMGGFDMLGAGRTKIETKTQFDQCAHTTEELELDGLVIIGGDDSNTSAALLAEDFLTRKLKTSVVGVPKTIDGDLKNEFVEISFGFDTASKTYSEAIGNILRDAISAKKYYFFIKLMGRTASHLTLECALQTHPNLALIGEEIEQLKLTFQDVTKIIADLIEKRSARGKDYGVILIPEGLIEFIPEFKKLINELNHLHAKKDLGQLENDLTPESYRCFNSLPESFKEQLLLERDSHGNVQVSKIETERLFIHAVEAELKKRDNFTSKLSTQPLFFGYEGRSGFPTNFDASYCYALGFTATLLIAKGATGYMSSLKNLTAPINEWIAGGVPITSMMNLEIRKGKETPVIAKALVNLEGVVFQKFKALRETWKIEDDYRYPGPIQFFGPEELTDSTTLTLKLESNFKRENKW